MAARKLLILLFLHSILAAVSLEADGQECTTLGQNPSTAFPVCGSNTFSQTSVPVCENGDVVVPACNNSGPYQAVNPYWYKFTCFTSGTLGLLISPNNPGDDYDWQLYDVTGQSLNAVFTDGSLVVGCNWSGVTGNTGASAAGTALTECSSLITSPGVPATTPSPFSAMPTLIQGHNYLLLISHFSGSDQSGYQLSFGGGTASITDTTPPALTGVKEVCRSIFQVTLNKKMSCASLAADGSDFSISPMPPGVQIIGASANSCSTGFDMDTLVLTLNGQLAPGNYTLAAKDGTDGNTLLDVCGTQVPVGQSLPLTVTFPPSTLFDSLTPPGCAPGTLQVVFGKPVDCSSIAADGSDFTVTGPVPVVVTGASGVCNANGLTNTVTVQLSAPIKTAGNFQLTLRAGLDGNTVIDECGVSIIPASLPFTTNDTVSAKAFTDNILYGCKQDTLQYMYPSEDGVNQWQWVFDDADTSLVQDPPERIYTVFGSKTVQLVVSNGTCSDTTQTTIVLGNAFTVGFEGPSIQCPKDYAPFVNNSTGDVTTWNWNFGDGTSSDQQTPDHLYPQTGVETNYTVTLIGTNEYGCSDTAAHTIDVLRSCFIAVPSAFTPNGDGVNDYLYPLNAFKAENLSFRVFDRYGQMVFETSDWQKKWDGTINGHAQPAGTYVWVLSYTDGETGKRIFQKGTTILIR